MYSIRSVFSMAALCIVALLACTTIGSAQTSAIQTDCECEATRYVTTKLCIDGTTYEVKIGVCEKIAPPLIQVCPQPAPAVHRWTFIRSICWTGPVVPTVSVSQVYEAILCNIKKTACESSNPWGVIVPATSIYYWAISFPLCTKTAADGCIYSCGRENCYTCHRILGLRRVAGGCTIVYDGVCTTGDKCDVDCDGPADCPRGEDCCD